MDNVRLASGVVVSEIEELRRLAEIAQQVGADEVTFDLLALAERAAEGRFYVACVGQFKRGKSTLINALVGHEVLPTGVVPVTSVPTVVRYGQDAARVRLRDNGWRAISLPELTEYVTEERNPGNAKGVLGAEVSVRAHVLRAGLCLVDTPGLGSVFEDASTATQEFVPQVDAAVVVLGADPPISGDELRLIREIANEVDDIIFVVNKADRLPADTRREAAAFTKRVVREHVGRSPTVLEVSALAAASGHGDPGAWVDLVERLECLNRGSSQHLIRGAIQRGGARLGVRIQWAIQQHLAALTRPIAESHWRSERGKDVARAAERALQELAPLLTAEQERIRLAFDTRREEFLKESVPPTQEKLRQAIADMPVHQRLTRMQVLDIAYDLARMRLLPWLSEMEKAADEEYRAAVNRFTEMGAQLLARAGELAGLDSASLLPTLDEGIRGTRGFQFTHLLRRHAPASPWRPLADLVLPRQITRRWWEQAAQRYLLDLLTVNAFRVGGALSERVQESRRQLESELRSLLRGAVATAGRAAEAALELKARGEEEVRGRLAFLEERAGELQTILRGIMDKHDLQGERGPG